MIPARIETPDNENCGKCLKNILAAAVKCSQCHDFFHPECTRMPDYIAIRYFTSRIAYACETCVTANVDEYQQLLAWRNNNRCTSDESHNESPNGDTSSEAVNRINTQLTGLMTVVSGMRLDIAQLAKKIMDDDEAKPRMYSDVTRAGRTQTQAQEKKQFMKNRQPNPSKTHAVFIKPKDGTAPINNEEVISALKNVPTVAMKTTQQKSVKLVFPTKLVKDRAVEALGASEQLTQTHLIASETKMKPKITIVFIPNNIDDAQIVRSIQDKNEQLADLIESERDMKLLFTKPSAPGFKTAVVSITPSIRQTIVKNGNRVYIQFSRCRVYDHYCVRRCGRCMAYGHETDHCHAKEPICGHCAQKHMSNECNNKSQLKCHHCNTSDREETEHSVFNTGCPAFITAKQRVIRRTMRCEDEETESTPKN